MTDMRNDTNEHEIDPLDFSELERARDPKVEPSARAAVKLSQDDPALRVPALPNRQLRKGAVVAAAVVCAAVACVSFAAAAGNRRALKATKDDESDFGKPIIPQALLNAPDRIVDPLQPIAAEDSAPLPAVPSPAANSGRRLSTGPARSSAAARVDREAEEELKAAAADILVQAEAPPPLPEDLVPTHERGMDSASPAGAATASETGGGSLANGDLDPNLQQRKNAFLNGTSSPDTGRLRATVRHPRSPFELKPGTIIPAVLVTTINSDLPGPVIARVTENVCDSVNGQWLLIPQGSTLVAYYDSMVAWGQERVLVCWKQLELPNGDSLDLGCMPAADTTGQAGLADEVDEHWWRIVKGAAVSSLLSAATTAAAGNTTGYNPSVPQMWARGAASEIGNAGENITRRNIMIQPTITVRQGMPVNVIVTKTVDFTPDGEPTSCGVYP